MTLAMLLPWFPIVLAVGAVCRLLNGRWGATLGLTGAAFWVFLTAASEGQALLRDGWLLAALVSGSVVVVGLGVWSGGTAGSGPKPRSAGPTAGNAVKSLRSTANVAATDHSDLAGRLSDELRRFEDWVFANRNAPDPWPDFAEMLRSVLFNLCGATHIRPFRVLSEGDMLLPLRAIEPGDDREMLSARKGIIGHVVTTGSTFLIDDPSHGELVDALAAESGGDIAWCFAIRQGGQTIGLVKVGQVGGAALQDRALLSMAEALANQHWHLLLEVCRSRAAQTLDPITGVHARDSFLRQADRIVADAYSKGEPVAMAIVTIEGMRGMADRGDWTLADALAVDAAKVLQFRLRSDDLLGRFDDSRFVILFRRIDSALGALIMGQVQQSLSQLGEDKARWAGRMTVRCGICGSGTEQPRMSELLSGAIAQCHQARRSVVDVVSDVSSVQEEDAESATAPTTSSASTPNQSPALQTAAESGVG